MLPASLFIETARRRGFGLFTGVPCSYLKPLINAVIDDSSLRYVAAANEGDAVAIAAGAELGGTRAVAMFQNSGLGNAVNPLTSLTYTSRLPVLLVVTLRGEPGGAPDEPQHALMGGITTGLLEQMEIPWEYFPAGAGSLDAVMDRADQSMRRQRRPFALVMRKGTVAPQSLHATTAPRLPASASGGRQPGRHRREAFLRAVHSNLGPRDVIVATTGYTGRELYACQDRPGQFYMVGSMGCASSLGLGLALARPDLRVIVLDGDGALLMRLGALATAGACRPDNLLHVLLDNGVHESTGGQSTASASIDFCAIAAACGYPSVADTGDPAMLGEMMADPAPGLRFARCAVLPGVADGLPRPAITPEQVTERFRHFIGTYHDGTTAPA